MILALFASLVVATTHAGECVTTEDWYVSVEMLPRLSSRDKGGRDEKAGGAKRISKQSSSGGVIQATRV